MTKAKGRVKQEQRLVNMAAPAPADTDVRWYPPDPEHDECYPINFLIGDDERIVGRVQFDQANRMTEFSLKAQIYFAGSWWDVVRFCTDHAEVHVHFYYRTRTYTEREVLYPIRCQDDVDRGYMDADKMLVVNWEDYVRRWHGGA